MKDRYELQLLACFVHGALTFGHCLGLIYNWRKRNRVDVLCHSLAIGYDFWAMKKHLKEVNHIGKDKTSSCRAASARTDELLHDLPGKALDKRNLG